MAEDDGGGVVMSVVVHLEAGSGSKANGGPSEPEGQQVMNRGVAQQQKQKRATRRHKRKEGSAEQGGSTGELVGDRDGGDG